MYDTYSCVGNYFYTKENRITFWLNLLLIIHFLFDYIFQINDKNFKIRSYFSIIIYKTMFPHFNIVYMHIYSYCIISWHKKVYFLPGWVLWHINHCRLFNTKSSLYIYIRYIWFSLVWWHINHCRLFNSKSSLYIYIRYIWFGLVGFYGISTIVGCLIPNPLYTYILYMYDLVWLSFMAYQPLWVV